MRKVQGNLRGDKGSRFRLRMEKGEGMVS